MPAKLDLTFARAEGRTLTMRLVDPKTNLGIDLTPITLTFTVRDELDSVSSLFQLSTSSGITNDPDQVANPGKFTIAISTANTTQILGDHFLDLFRDDERVTDVESRFRITASARFGSP